MRKPALALAAILVCSRLAAQSSPFVDDSVERLLVNEISGDLAFETLRITTQWHKPGGSEGFFAVARYIEERAKAAGLQDVRWIDQVADSPSWTCKRAEAWLIEGEGDSERRTKLGSFAEVATSIADYSRSADVTARLVDVGTGEKASDYEGKDVRGQVVLASGSVGTVMEQAVWKRGAAGILSWGSSRLNPLAEGADQIAWLQAPSEDGPKGEKTTFAFVISRRAGNALSDRIRGDSARRWGGGGATDAAKGLRVHVVVDAVTLPDKKTAMVEARIPGTDPSLPEVVLTGHLQEEKFSANDDQSGVASALEIGRALTRLIQDGRLPRPRRGIRFWWCDEIYSEYRYFADHPGEEKKVLADLNQDMVGAKQSDGSRVQYMARTPWYQPSYLNDLQQSVLEAVVAGNHAYLAAWQAGSIPPGIPFSRPIFSHLGTREPYRAQAVPYFDSTDHMVFNDPWVGAPGTTLTNWPDEYIHSSGDDLWQIDSTQLKRNAYVVAATAWWLANAGPADVDRLAAFVAARGAARLARDLATAQAWIARGEGDEAARRRGAAGLMEVSLQTELAALDSVRRIAAPADEAAVKAAADMLRGVAGALSARLGAAASGEDAAMTRLAARVPKRSVASLAEWLTLERQAGEKRRAAARAKRDAEEAEAASKKPGKKAGKPAAPATPAADGDETALSPLMGASVLGWVDGKRDAADIARRVCAEALSAGWWYYGETTPERVEKYLQAQVKNGLIVW
jgi:hypothetical protein